MRPVLATPFASTWLTQARAKTTTWRNLEAGIIMRNYKQRNERLNVKTVGVVKSLRKSDESL